MLHDFLMLKKIPKSKYGSINPKIDFVWNIRQIEAKEAYQNNL